MTVTDAKRAARVKLNRRAYVHLLNSLCSDIDQLTATKADDLLQLMRDADVITLRNDIPQGDRMARTLTFLGVTSRPVTSPQTAPCLWRGSPPPPITGAARQSLPNQTANVQRPAPRPQAGMLCNDPEFQRFVGTHATKYFMTQHPDPAANTSPCLRRKQPRRPQHKPRRRPAFRCPAHRLRRMARPHYPTTIGNQ